MTGRRKFQIDIAAERRALRELRDGLMRRGVPREQAEAEAQRAVVRDRQRGRKYGGKPLATDPAHADLIVYRLARA